MRRRWLPSGTVGAVLAHEIVHGVIGIDGLAGIAPEPLLYVVSHLPLVDVVIIDVGDLQFASSRRLKLTDDVEHAGFVTVNAGDAVLGSRDFGLLLDMHDSPVVTEDRDAEMTQVLGLAHRGEQDAGPNRVRPEGIDDGPDGAFDDVVGEPDEHWTALGEVRRQSERFGDPTGVLLIAVRQLIDPILVTVA